MVSERRACRALGQARSTQRFAPTKAQTDKPLVAAMLEVARQHPRYGYRRVHAMLEREGFRAGRDRVYRLWRLHGLRVPRRTHRRRRLGSSANGVTRHRAERIDHVWTYDFVSDQTTDGRRLKILTVEDEYTRESLALEVDRRFRSRDVIGVLRELFAVRGAPAHLRSDNGPEFIARAVRAWLEEHRVGPLYIEPGAPWENAHGESFNGKLRDECLNLELFTSLAEARVVTGDFRAEYNHRRPHSSLDYRTPAEFAAVCRAGGNRHPVPEAPGKGPGVDAGGRRTPLRLAPLASAPSPARPVEAGPVQSDPLIQAGT
jgi:transposase InsO family protein